ncbi:MAG: HD domain-containing protein [Kiritimatiellae bacterium]|nr:HD domain-containing protein [Kiritimatiellia bacterium]
MKAIEARRLSKWFEAYLRKFAGKDGKLPPMLQLKLDHSRRVAADAAAIARDLGFDSGDARTAGTLGLLHDVGRFVQFTRHRTFRDDHSLDHGRRGAEILAASVPLATCSDPDRRRLTTGVLYHNKMNLPAGLAPDVIDFVRLIRDADKLDISFVLYRAWKNGDLLRSPDITFHVNLEGPLNPGALEEIKRRKSVSMKNVKSLHDFFLLQLSWVYDFNFRPSYQRLLRRAFIEKIAGVLPRTREITSLIALARKHVKKQLDSAKPVVFNRR